MGLKNRRNAIDLGGGLKFHSKPGTGGLCHQPTAGGPAQCHAVPLGFGPAAVAHTTPIVCERRNMMHEKKECERRNVILFLAIIRVFGIADHRTAPSNNMQATQWWPSM